MTLRRGVLVVAVAASVVALAIPIAIGSAAARGGAIVGVAGIAVGLTAAVRMQRAEYADDAVQPSLAHVLGETVSGVGMVIVGMVIVGMSIVFVVLLFGATAPGSGPREEAGWIGPVLATIASAALVIGMVGTVRVTWRREGIERQTLLEATCFAFFVMLLLAGAYGLFEAVADAA